MSPFQPSITAIERPRCPRCQRRMKLECVSPGPEGLEHRLFECSKCDHAETRAVPDPIKSKAVRWFAGELRGPE
jgi:Zn ribbon nucleic-acid-binding protein